MASQQFTSKVMTLLEGLPEDADWAEFVVALEAFATLKDVEASDREFKAGLEVSSEEVFREYGLE